MRASPRRTLDSMTDFEEDWDDDETGDDSGLDPDAEFLGGRLLIAMPGIEDPRFEQALVLVCAHTPEHAMGITLNRPLDGVTVPDLLSRLGVQTTIELPPQLVLAGGPVERERGFVLHTDDFTAPESTVPVADGVSLTATRDVLQAMGDPDVRPRCSTLALGYAGWGPGQLEREIRENVWLTCDVDEKLVFDDEHASKWSRALAKLGVNAATLSSQSGSA
jgi:putative transcriptional regulator